MSYKIIEEYIETSTTDIKKKFVAKFLLEFCKLSDNSEQYEEMLGFMLESGTVDEVIDMYKLKINEDINIVELYYTDENKDEILMSKFTMEKYKEIIETLPKTETIH